MDGQTVYVFSWQISQIPLRPSRLGIRSLSAEECEHLFRMSLYTIGSIIGSLEEKVGALARSRAPVMIISESGTGKEQIARALYLRGPLIREPFISVDCSVMDERSWSFLLSHTGSPLNSRDITVFFHHMEDIPAHICQELVSVVQDTGIARRIRLLFSCDVPPTGILPEHVRLLTERLSCTILQLPPLRSRADEIPSLAARDLRRLGMESGKELLGLEPHAQELLQTYDWPGNYAQFRRVLNELSAITAIGYVSTDAVAGVLAHERARNHPIAAPLAELQLRGRTLAELEEQIIRHVFAENNGNQTATAR